jgi:hypothetical protein
MKDGQTYFAFSTKQNSLAALAPGQTLSSVFNLTMDKLHLSGMKPDPSFQL